MARFSSLREFSPTGTVLPIGESFSNAVKTEAAKDARVYANVAVVPAGASIDILVQASADNIDFADIKACNNIAAVGVFLRTLNEEELATFTRLRYVVVVDTITLGATLEKKQGV